MRLSTAAPMVQRMLLVILLMSDAATAFGASNNKVLLKNIQTLTVRKDKQTTHRRVSAVPQLKCIGGRGCQYYSVDVMRCENAGMEYDESSVQWTCRASLPEYFKLGSTDVRCEGYSSSSDPYVLKGSCGVEYRLLLTDRGEEKYGPGTSSWFGSKEDASNGDESGAFAKLVFWLLFAGVVFIMARGALRNYRDGAADRRRRGPRGPQRPPGFGGGGGGGGFDDGHDDPPPPYSPDPPRRKQQQSTRSSTTRQQQQGAGWGQPGFWGGLAGGTVLGATVGHLAGRGRNQQQSAAGPSGTNAGRRSRQQEDNSSFASSSFHQSTGFGGTSNR